VRFVLSGWRTDMLARADFRSSGIPVGTPEPLRPTRRDHECAGGAARRSYTMFPVVSVPCGTWQTGKAP